MKTILNLLFACALLATLLAATGCEQISPFISDEVFNKRLDRDQDGVPNTEDCAPDDPTITTFSFWHDLDGDGFGAGEVVKGCALKTGLADKAGDCNDGNANIYPGAAEVCDLVDNNCNNQVDEGFVSRWYRDKDQDGFGNLTDHMDDCGKPNGYVDNDKDCNDNDAAIKPGAMEVCDDKIDQDCDGKTDNALNATLWFADVDGDGAGNPAVSFYSCKAQEGHVIVTGDCNDANPSIGPFAPEACYDGIDNDCDGVTDTDAVDVSWYRDFDGDGFGDPKVAQTACKPPVGFVGNDLDCDDTKNTVKPGIAEVCNNGIDDNCDGDVNQCKFPSTHTPASADVNLQSSVPQAHAGSSITNVGDVNNDTFQDLAIGSPDANGGMAYLFFGPINAGTLNISTANTVFTAEASTGRAGWMIAGIGDVNNDTVDDLAISADEHNGGTVYVFFGPITPGTKNLSTANVIFTAEGDSNHAGWSIAGIGDVNNDTIDDLAIGAPSAVAQAGIVYVFFGPITQGTKSLATANVKLTGEAAGDRAGSSVIRAGDINKDTFSDIAVGAPNNPENPGTSSASYIFFGPITQGTKSLATANVKLSAEVDGQNAGWSLAGDADVNGDSFLDLAISAPRKNGKGVVYLFLGPITSGQKSLSNANMKFLGQHSGGRTGNAIAFGYWNGDGIADLGIGVPNSSGIGPNDVETGNIYIVFGLGL